MCSVAILLAKKAFVIGVPNAMQTHELVAYVHAYRMTNTHYVRADHAMYSTI